MKSEQVFIVKYNDLYGNGTDTYLECVVRSRDEFYEWLDWHNDLRQQLENEPEDEELFTLIPISLVTFK